MFTQLLQYNDVGLFLLRSAVAVIFIYHGLPKISKPQMMAQGMGVSSMMVIVLGLVEVLSALGLVLGVYIQLSALLLVLVMVGAIKMKGINWGVPFSAMDKTGWEFDLILFITCVAILLGGGGTVVPL
jgi:putative oxidoreductase